MKNRTSKKQAALRVLSFILAAVITLNLSSTSSFFIVNAEGIEEEIESDTELVYSDNICFDLPDSAELEEMYIGQLFYGGEASFYKDNGRDQLTGDSLKLYDYLRDKIESIANGDTTDTVVSYKFPTPYNSAEEFKEDFSTIVDALLFDLPHTFYWYDKTKGTGMQIYGNPVTGEVSRCDLLFSVSENYADTSGVVEGFFVKTDPQKINAAKNAVANAQAIVNECSGLSDYEKIQEFKKRICNLTEYNHDAADNEFTPYGDPWQIVYVFDGDPTTNVVCEGYSKAFQYLCDLSGIDCYTVTGEMSGGTGAGGHMWNIVMLRGQSYLVDITNCDDGSAGAPDKLLLKGAAASDENGCIFTNTSPNLTYTYDRESQIYPGAILKVSTVDYSPDNEDLPHDNHRICVHTSSCPDDTHENIEWKPWEGTNSMPLTAGSYYLTADVTLNESWVLPSGSTNLCLYGHTITFDDTVVNSPQGIISIKNSDDTLSICDCTGGGKITGGTADQGGAIYNNGTLNLYSGELSGNTAADDGGAVYSSGTFNMYGGTITANTTSTNGCGAVYIASGSTFRIYGGEIKGNTSGSGVHIDDSSCNVTVGEAPVIKDNGDSANPVNLYLPESAAVIIDPDHPLRAAAYIGITTEETPADGSPVTISTGNADNYNRCFRSDREDYQLIGSSGTIQLAVKTAPAPHSHTLCIGNGNTCPDHIHGTHTEISWTPWDKTDSLPTTAGSYYLTDDVTLSAAWEVPGSETSLCLNGYTITVDSTVINDTAPLENGLIYIKDDTVAFNLCDCTGEGIITGGVSKVGGAVYNSGTFNMFSGKISGNKSSGNGGGVYTDREFFMYGGEISENVTDDHGGGVYARGTFTMYGGNIIKNAADKQRGGGVYIYYGAKFFMYGGRINNNSARNEGGGLCSYGTVNMYDGEINENRVSVVDGGIYNHGTFNMHGGEISKNTAAGHAGVCNPGTFNMYGGKINENKATSDYAGGVCNLSGGSTFNMYGGEISGNSACGDGGGMYNSTTTSIFNMLGGTISGNTSGGRGGGVFALHSSNTVGGTIVIKDNFGAGDREDDLYLLDGTIIKINSDKPLEKGSNVGIRTHNEPDYGNKIRFTNDTEGEYIDYFHSSLPEVSIEYREGAFWVRMPPHAHALCVDGDCPYNINGEHQELEWERWTNTSALPTDEGNYFLTADVALTESWKPVDGVNLCLNGFIISLNKPDSPIIEIEEDVTFNLCNCSKTGGGINGAVNVVVSGNNIKERGTSCIINHGTFGMYGGTIHNNKASSAEGGGVFNDATFKMYGGSITGNIAGKGSGVYNKGEKLVLGGKAVINLCNPDNLYMCDNTFLSIDSSHPLKGNSYISVTTQTEPHDQAIILSTENDADYSDFFRSDKAGYEIITNRDNKLQLMSPHPHTTEFVPTVQPKCEECGYEEHYRCTACGKLFNDEGGNSRILRLSEIEIEPTGHSWGEWKSDDEGHWKSCENLCGLVRLKEPHIWDEGVVTLPPTDQTDGAKIYTCQLCNHTKTEVLPKTGADQPEPEPTPAPNPADDYYVVVYGRIFKSGISPDYDCKILDEITDLSDNLLRPEEIALVANGSVIELRLTIDKIDEISAADTELIKKSINDYSLCQNLDINLYKIIDGESTKITKTNSPIAVEIKLPDELIKENREYALLRVHDGENQIIPDIDKFDETVTFLSDRFSFYALIYKDKEVEVNPDPPMQTGVNDNIAIFMSIGVTALAVFTALTAMGSGIGAMSEVSKDRMYYKLIRWGRKGGRVRRVTALALIFLLLTYYYGIGMHQYEATDLTAE